MTIWLPDGPQTVGRTPAVSREWLADGPEPAQPSPGAHPQPDRTVPLAVALVVLVALTASLLAGLAPLEAAATALLAGSIALLAADRLAGLRRDSVDVLVRARSALLFGEDARRVLGRLRGVEAPGRAGRFLGITRRCLEEAGRHSRLEEVLRWEAVRWLGRTMEALSREVE